MAVCLHVPRRCCCITAAVHPRYTAHGIILRPGCNNMLFKISQPHVVALEVAADIPASTHALSCCAATYKQCDWRDTGFAIRSRDEKHEGSVADVPGRRRGAGSTGSAAGAGGIAATPGGVAGSSEGRSSVRPNEQGEANFSNDSHSSCIRCARGAVNGAGLSEGADPRCSPGCLQRRAATGEISAARPPPCHSAGRRGVLAPPAS